MNKIKRTAKKYIKANKKRDLDGAINFLKQSGYEVIFFNTPTGNELIKVYGLEWYKETKRAFTCYEEKALKAVFVDETLHNSDKLNLLLHETGHIMLKHIGEGQNEHYDTVSAEVEADAFAYEVMNYTHNGRTALIVFSLIASFISGLLIGDIPFAYPVAVKSDFHTTSYVQSTPRPTPRVYVNYNDSADNIYNPVYVTPSGTKYHERDCRYVKNKTNIKELSLEEAQIEYTPCSVCNP